MRERRELETCRDRQHDSQRLNIQHMPVGIGLFSAAVMLSITPAILPTHLPPPPLHSCALDLHTTCWEQAFILSAGLEIYTLLLSVIMSLSSR